MFKIKFHIRESLFHENFSKTIHYLISKIIQLNWSVLILIVLELCRNVSEFCQTSEMDHFAKIVKQLVSANYFCKTLYLICWQGSGCTTAMYERSTPTIKMKKRPVYTKGNACKGTEKHELRKDFPISWFQWSIVIIISRKLYVFGGSSCKNVLINFPSSLWDLG